MTRIDDLTRPIIGIENRTAQEAFDIMCDRIRYALNEPMADDAATCFICLKSINDGDMVLDDVTGGVGHRDCYGNDRDAFVKDLDTGEPLGPDDPLPKGYVWRSSLIAEAGEPVAWRVKDYGDGWIFCTDEKRAQLEAVVMGGALVQSLYASPTLPTPTDEDVERAARAMVREAGFDPDEIMVNDGPRWRYYARGARAALAAFMKKEG